MTKAELIEALKDMPDDAEVIYPGGPLWEPVEDVFYWAPGNEIHIQ